MNETNDSVGLLPAFTFVLWAGCAIVGVAGLTGPPVQLASPTTQPVDATPIEVSLLADPADSAMLSPSLDAPTPPVLDAAPTDDVPPAPAAVAPSPAVAFAVPIDAPASIAPAARPAPPARATAKSSIVTRRSASSVKPGGVRQLTFGSGEGRQPAPDYPTDAAVAGQQGSVGVLFGVDAGGLVTQANVETGSGWPALNEAAVEAVRDTWRFAPGIARTYRVTIQFRLSQ